MLINELRSKTVDELNVLVGEIEAKLRDARFKLATRQFPKVSEIAVWNTDLARVKTVLRSLTPRA